MDLARIQEALRRENLDGWLFFDHHERDPLAYRVLGLPAGLHVTRRWYYLIPAHGEPIGIVHRIEAGVIERLPGEKLPYSSWQEQHARLAQILKGKQRVAMQYSPLCAVPYVAMVDAGTIELIRSFGVEVVTSAELIQEFEACLTDEQFPTHLAAGRLIDRIREGAFRLIREKLASGVDEITVRDWILDRLPRRRPAHRPRTHRRRKRPRRRSALTNPRPETNVSIKQGDLVLLDMWAKFDRPGSVFYDITWTGVVRHRS